MTRNNRSFVAVARALAFAAPLAAPRACHARTFSSWDKWASWSDGPWTISNNVWGGNAGPEGLYVNSVNNWYVESWQNARPSLAGRRLVRCLGAG